MPEVDRALRWNWRGVSDGVQGNVSRRDRATAIVIHRRAFEEGPGSGRLYLFSAAARFNVIVSLRSAGSLNEPVVGDCRGGTPRIFPN